MNPPKPIISSGLAATITRAVGRSFAAPTATAGLRTGYYLCRHGNINTHRQFSTSHSSLIDFFPPAKETKEIKQTPPAWPHPRTTEDQLNSIEIAHRPTRTWADRAAFNMVRLLRWGTDLATGYRDDPNRPYNMNERKWFVRFIFLETVAAVPGMTAGMLRHFRSLRRMQRDNGWIETMLEDAYNERMHLLTFMKMAEPGWLMKFLVMGAQGVFANGFFLAYLFSPATCHRFVGYLEEEAVKTYTHAIRDLDQGKIPAWNHLQAPDIAVSYWNMPEGKRSMRDLLLYVRADEAKHREIHHTLGNLNQKEDPNPFVSVYKDPSKPHPGGGLNNLKSTGWEREDII